MSQLEIAAEWITGLTLDAVPADVVELARAQRINILASLYAGARTAPGRAITAAVDAWDVGGSIRTLPDGRERSLQAALYLQAVHANALELDDFVFAGHTGQAAVGVPLVLGQGHSGEQVLLAQIAANEVAGRLGAVMTAGPQHGHMKAYLHRAAATTAAARLLELDASQTATALAISLSAPEYPLFPAAFSAETKVLCTGDPVVAGVRAAFLAAEGIGAAADIVEHAVGLVTSLSHYDRAPPIWDRLGEAWSMSAICFKPFAACAYAAAAASAVSEIVADQGDAWDPARVADIDVHTTVLTLTMEGFSKPHKPGVLTPVNTNFSTRRTVALAMLDGDPRGEQFLPERFAELSPSIQALSDRVRLHHYWPYTIHMLRGVDVAIDHPGRPGIYGMAEAHRTMDRFKAAFGTPAAVSAGDIPALLRMERADLWYLLRRYAIGYRSRLPFWAGEEARRAYVSRATDLRQMSLRFGARVEVHLDDGRTLSHEVLTPPGFAGDPDRLRIPPEKFRREVGSAASPARADSMLAVLQSQPFASSDQVIDAALDQSG